MATTFKIDRGIPLPESKKGLSKYPWRHMGVGESFLFSSDVDQRAHATAAAQAGQAGKRHNFKFTTRKTADGIRVWRVA